jgi:2-amino-4-hydroxy-6-hydroxymethyldihydropteridine diphosphokinase
MSLRQLGEMTAVSSLYETEPVGGPQQGPYLNAVVVLDSALDPADLLEEALRIEREAGRVRAERWAPRTLDLDLITAVGPDGAVRRDSPALRLPHPRAAERAFVLVPLAEVWPQAPLGDLTAAEALAGLSRAGVEELGADWLEDRPGRGRAMVLVQGLLLLGHAGIVAATAVTPLAVGPAVGGGALVLGGLGLMVWAASRLGSAFTALPDPRPGSRLVSEGPYRFLRHPIYLGLIVAMVGSAVASRSLPAVGSAGAVAAFLAAKAGYEERQLRVKVAGYPDYQRRVGGFWPRISPR